MQQAKQDTVEYQERQAVWASFATKMTAGVGSRDTETHKNETALAFARTYILHETIKEFIDLRNIVNEERKKSEDMNSGGYGVN